MFKGQSFPMKHYFISGLGYRRIIYPTARFVRMEERDGESLLKQGLWGWRRGTENLYSCKVCKDGGKGRRIYPQVRFVRVEERDGESILKQGLWGWRRGTENLYSSKVCEDGGEGSIFPQEKMVAGMSEERTNLYFFLNVTYIII